MPPFPVAVHYDFKALIAKPVRRMKGGVSVVFKGVGLIDGPDDFIERLVLLVVSAPNRRCQHFALGAVILDCVPDCQGLTVKSLKKVAEEVSKFKL